MTAPSDASLQMTAASPRGLSFNALPDGPPGEHLVLCNRGVHYAIGLFAIGFAMAIVSSVAWALREPDLNGGLLALGFGLAAAAFVLVGVYHLYRFDRIEIDFANEKVTWRRRRGARLFTDVVSLATVELVQCPVVYGTYRRVHGVALRGGERCILLAASAKEHEIREAYNNLPEPLASLRRDGSGSLFVHTLPLLSGAP